MVCWRAGGEVRERSEEEEELSIERRAHACDEGGGGREEGEARGGVAARRHGIAGGEIGEVGGGSKKWVELQASGGDRGTLYRSARLLSMTGETRSCRCERTRFSLRCGFRRGSD